LVIVRWATDRWAVAFSASGASRKQWDRNTHQQNQNAQNVGRVGFADVFGRSSCRLAPTLFTKKARRSVAHLTFANPSWRSVPTCSVLLHTEAGGTPAFQSFAASRQGKKFSAKRKEKKFRVAEKKKKFRVAEPDWNAGIPPASVRKSTKKV
jgi:hypothetical protein